MLSGNHGLSTIECLVALLVATTGVLGSVGTVALSLRTAAAGRAAATAARLAGATLDSLRGAVEAAGQECAAISGGSVAGMLGTGATWRVAVATGGRQLELLVSYRTVRGTHVDTLPGFLPCR